MNNDLTIILTLRGRHLHTLRWMWHANRVKLPFHVIVADGEVHPAVDRVLSVPANFPNLSYEYHKHCDQSFTDYYRKCAETARKVKTKYVMMSDNDDFLIVTGVLRSVAHLNADSEYVCAGGEIPNFTVIPFAAATGNVVGEMVDLSFNYVQGVHDITFQSISERVGDVLEQYHVTFYHVFRTQALTRIFEEAERHDFSDLTAYEYFCAARAVTLGKVRSDPSVIGYLRQTGTSMLSTYYKDWVHHLLHSNLPQDYRAMASAIAGEIVRHEGGDFQGYCELILDAHARRLRHLLGHTMMRYRFPRMYAIKQKLAWLRDIKMIPRSLRNLLTTKAFWRTLSRDCPQEGLSRYQADFRDIAQSLESKAFLTFVGSHAAELVSSSHGIGTATPTPPYEALRADR